MYLAIFYGLMYALSDGLIYFVYAAAFRFAAFLITLEPENAAFTDLKGIVTYVSQIIYTLYSYVMYVCNKGGGLLALKHCVPSDLCGVAT